MLYLLQTLFTSNVHAQEKNIKVIAGEIFSTIGSAADYTWVASHGITINLTYVCSLQHYVDNAWGDDEWFYGEQTSTVSYGKY